MNLVCLVRWDGQNVWVNRDWVLDLHEAMSHDGRRTEIRFAVAVGVNQVLHSEHYLGAPEQVAAALISPPFIPPSDGEVPA